MKLLTLANSALLIVLVLYIFNSNGNFGAVRSRTTGFQVISGDQISIGTSTPISNLHIYETATTSIAIDGKKLGCLRLLDTDASGYTNITALNGTIGTSTDADCGY